MRAAALDRRVRKEARALVRDARGAIGRIKVLGPSAPARRAAMSTTPPEQSHVA